MDQPQEHPPEPSGVGRLYISFAKSSPRKTEKRRAVLSCMPPVNADDACLDIGTGHGGLAHFFARRGTWTFLDVMPDRLAVARTILRGEFACEAALAYLARPRAFRLITCIDAIQYIDLDIDKVVQAIHRRLEPGGFFLVSAENERPDDAVVRLRRRLGVEAAAGYLVNPDEPAMRRSLRTAGFRIARNTNYCGPLTLAAQTMLDLVAMRSGDGGDRLTGEIEEGRLGLKLAASRVLSGLSLAVGTVDRTLKGLPRYGYVLLGEKI